MVMFEKANIFLRVVSPILNEITVSAQYVSAPPVQPARIGDQLRHILNKWNNKKQKNKNRGVFPEVAKYIMFISLFYMLLRN